MRVAGRFCLAQTVGENVALTAAVGNQELLRRPPALRAWVAVVMQIERPDRLAAEQTAAPFVKAQAVHSWMHVETGAVG